MQNVIQYGIIEMQHLKLADSKLGEAIERIGMIEREQYPDFYEGFTNAVIGQQISSKAMNTIWNRLLNLCGTVTPESVLSFDEEQLRHIGLSHRKILYLKNCAQMLGDGVILPDTFSRMNDNELVKYLMQLKGVGKWTAQMLMIFTLGRKDVLSFGDFGIRKGICLLHNMSELSLEQFYWFQERYSPYGTVASIYLWEIARGR